MARPVSSRVGRGREESPSDRPGAGRERLRPASLCLGAWWCDLDERYDLVLVDGVGEQIATIPTMDQALEVRDQAEALRVYYRRRDGAEEMSRRAAEVKLRAERRIGELLPEPSRGGRRESGNRLLPEGVEKMQAHRFRKVAEVPAEVFETFITEAEEVTTAGLIREAKKVERDERVEEVLSSAPEPAKALNNLDSLAESIRAGEREPFACIYADPPWQYGNQGTRGATNNHYATMKMADIEALPVSGLAAEQAHLHLWTTSVFLPDALRLIHHWGFDYKSYLVWDKPQFGLGNYWRGPCELLLLGVRGKLKFQDHSIKAILREDRTRHSAKPAPFRTLIERASPGPRLEMFARVATPGWTAWGNEIEEGLFVVEEKA